MLLPIHAEHPEPRKIRRATELLEQGAVLGYPTDTVYALGCDPLNKKAVEKLYQIKGLPRTELLALVCRDLSEVAEYAVIHDVTFRLLKHLLPGPYCFILRATRKAPKSALSPRKTVAIRVSNHPVPQALCNALGRPLLSSSAMRGDAEPNPDPKEIDFEFPGLALVIDAGPGGTTPTSVIDLSAEEPRVVREGAGDVTPFLA